MTRATPLAKKRPRPQDGDGVPKTAPIYDSSRYIRLLGYGLHRFGHSAFMAWLMASSVLGAAVVILAFSQPMIALVPAIESL